MNDTLIGRYSYQEEIKKSRFLAFADSVQSPADALHFFARHSAADASHNCWAYCIGQAYRFNDDGEPGGTAGRPILQAIERQKCDQVAVLVIRWFGGVKLGTGGLARAYSGVTAQCLRQAPRRPLIDEIRVQCHCPFADLARVQSQLARHQARIQSEQFDGDGVCWQLAVPRSRAAALAGLFADLTRARGQWLECDD